MRQSKLFTLLCVVNVVLAVVVLSILYVWRVLGFEWGVWSLLLVGYGLVVTPFLLFRLVSAYSYKPVCDVGYRPKVSVIIPCYNEEEHIISTIKAVLYSEYLPDLLDVILVDDKSTDNSLQVVSRSFHGWFCRVLSLPVNVGKRHAMAAGIKEATGDIIVCVDSDTVIAMDALTHLVQPFIDPLVFCVCGNAAVINCSSVVARFQKVWYDEAFRVRKGVESLFGSVLLLGCFGCLSPG
jgi:hyaluronan synthase